MSRPIAIEELLEHAAWLRRLAASLVADPGRADDLVQETWLAALRRPPAEDVAPRRWLARVVRNVARNRARMEVRRSEREELRGAQEPACAPAAIAAEAEAQRLLAEAVLELDEPLRAVIVLRYFRGLDSNATARELGIPAGTVRWRTSQALEELRARLDRRFGGEREAWMLVLVPLVGRELPPLSTGAGNALTSAPALLAAALLAGVIVTVLIRPWLGRSSTAAELPIAAQPHAEAEAVSTSAAEEELHGSSAREAPLEESVLEVPATSAPGAEISGVVLVDGRAPRVPLVLELGIARAPMPAVDARDLPAVPASREGVRSWHAPVGQDGSFRFSGLSQGFRGRLRAAGYDIEEPGLALVTAPTTGLVLRLRREPAITGRVLDTQGVPAPEFDGLVRYEIDSEAPGGAGDVSALMPFQTDAEGYFRIPLENVDEDTTAGASLIVEHERGRATLETGRFDPLVGLDLGEVELEPVRTLRVRVGDASGAPLPGAVARVMGPIPCSRASEPTDGDGACVLGFAPAGALRLRIDALRFRTRVLDVAEEASVDVVLEPVSGLELHLSAEDPAVLRTLQVLLRGPSALFPAAPRTEEGPQALDLELESFIREELGATPMHGSHGSPPGESTTTWHCSAGARVVLPDLAAGIPFELEVRARDERVLATRTVLLGPAEWLALELRVDP